LIFTFTLRLFLNNLEGDGQVNEKLLKERDQTMGISTEAKRKQRESFLTEYNKVGDSDEWEKEGKVPQVVMVEKDLVNPF
jgi:hypothetical protein